MHCLPGTETLAQQDVDAKNRQHIFDKSSGKRRQSILICYDLIGFIPLSELMEQEMA